MHSLDQKKGWQSKNLPVAEPPCLNPPLFKSLNIALHKQASEWRLKRVSWTVAFLSQWQWAVRAEMREWNLTQVYINTWGEHSGSVRIRLAMPNTEWHWLYRHMILVLTFQASTQQVLCCTSVCFGTFWFGFYSVSSIQVPLQRHQLATAVITVAIFEYCC